MTLARPKPHSFSVSSIAEAHSRLFVFMMLAVLLATLLSTLAVESAAAQDIFGRISGTVTDPTGAVIPSAKITITNATIEAIMWRQSCQSAATA